MSTHGSGSDRSAEGRALPLPQDDPVPDASALAQEEVMAHPGHLVRRLHQISVSVFLAAARDGDVTQVQFGTMAAVDCYPGIDQTSLGKVVALDRQTISNVIQRLVAKGLVDRQKKDKRTSALFLTGAGRDLLHATRERIGGVDALILQPLTEAEQHVFMTLLRKLVDDNNTLSRAPMTMGRPAKGRAGKA